MEKITIGDTTLKVKIVHTDEEKEKGLQGIKNLPKDEGMLFIFDTPQEVSIWMKDTLIPLDIIFINDDLEVENIYSGEPMSEKLFTEMNTLMVLELNAGSNIKKGDDIEFGDNAVKKSTMLVLDENGNPQMELSGGERIFSRANTKTLIKFAKKAQHSKKDNDYMALGKRVFKFLKVQNDSEPEFVSKK